MIIPVALLTRKAGALVAEPARLVCESCDEKQREICEWFGCPYDTALDAPGVVVGRSYLDIKRRRGA